MNNKKRNSLRKASEFLSRAAQIIEEVHADESDCLDNYPENLQGTEKYEKIENIVDVLESISEDIDEIQSNISLAIG